MSSPEAQTGVGAGVIKARIKTKKGISRGRSGLHVWDSGGGRTNALSRRDQLQ